MQIYELSTVIPNFKFKLPKCVCNFVTCDDFGRLYPSNLGDFVKDFYKLRMIFISNGLELNQILQIKESVPERL